MATRIRGIEGMKSGELEFEIQRGAKFVLFSILHFDSDAHVSPAFGYLLFAARRKHGDERPAVHVVSVVEFLERF